MLERAILFVGGKCLGIPLSHSIWQRFGYAGVPSRGRIVDWFVNRDELAREAFLLKELLVASCLPVYEALRRDRAFPHRAYFMDGVVRYLIDGPVDALWPSFRFESREEALAYIFSSLRQFSCSPEIMDSFANEICSRSGGLAPSVWIKASKAMFVAPEFLEIQTAMQFERTLKRGFSGYSPSYPVVAELFDSATTPPAKNTMQSDA